MVFKSQGLKFYFYFPKTQTLAHFIKNQFFKYLSKTYFSNNFLYSPKAKVSEIFLYLPKTEIVKQIFLYVYSEKVASQKT